MKLLVLLSTLLVLWGCGQPQVPRFPHAPVILITVDTLRADRLPVYGYSGIQAPNFETFARESIVFESAWATVPVTLPSHASLFTGLVPAGHGVRENVGFKLPEGVRTLAEILLEQGYQTGAAVSSMVLRHSTGIAQGFEFYNDRPGKDQQGKTYTQRSGLETIGVSLHQLQNRDPNKPVFFWLHLYEPHTPYTPPPPYSDLYPDPYDGEVAYADQLVGQFLDGLKQLGLYDPALIFLLSDHGEGLGDHGEEEHGLFVYREALQVPFLLKLPQSTAGGTRISEPVGLTDVFPTTLDLLGLPVPDTSGAPLLSGRSIASRPIYSEALTAKLYYGWHASYSIAYKNHHYIESKDLMTFDLERDFQEKSDLRPDHFPAEVAQKLNETRGDTQTLAEISQQDREMLASLGYVGDFQVGDDILGLSAGALLEIHQGIAHAQQLIQEDRLDEAETSLVNRLNQFPSLLGARIMLGQVLYQKGKYEKAEFVCTEGLATAPDNERLLLGLAAIKLAMGKTGEAQLLARRSIERAPLLCGQRLIPLFYEKGLISDVLDMASRVAPHDPAFAFAWTVYSQADSQNPAGVAHLMQQTRTNQKIDLADFLAGANLLGELYAGHGHQDLAAAIWQNNLKEDPGFGPSRINQGRYFANSGSDQKALEIIDQWLYDFPSREHYLAAARLMDELGRHDAAAFYRKQSSEYP